MAERPDTRPDGVTPAASAAPLAIATINGKRFTFWGTAAAITAALVAIVLDEIPGIPGLPAVVAIGAIAGFLKAAGLPRRSRSVLAFTVVSTVGFTLGAVFAWRQLSPPGGAGLMEGTFLPGLVWGAPEFLYLRKRVVQPWLMIPAGGMIWLVAAEVLEQVSGFRSFAGTLSWDVWSRAAKAAWEQPFFLLIAGIPAGLGSMFVIKGCVGLYQARLLGGGFDPEKAGAARGDIWLGMPMLIVAPFFLLLALT